MVRANFPPGARGLALSLTLALSQGACGGGPQSRTEPLPEESDEPGVVTIVQYEKKTAELMETSRKLAELRGNADEQSRRLAVICTDYPDHQVCQPQTAAEFAREAFCKDKDFTEHVNRVVDACHQGECKQVDQAEQISRSEYMLLTQRLPHLLITFGASNMTLDGKDKKRLQQFVEAVRGERGYMIIVGRASKDGNWRNNLKLALGRAENTRKYLVDEIGVDQKRAGYITYGADKMYLTQLDAERLTEEKLTTTQANRSALVFSYPCYDVTFEPREIRPEDTKTKPELPRVE
jgi:outer membrane protein OmpA-like peptidoglycan-associated protein